MSIIEISCKISKEVRGEQFERSGYRKGDFEVSENRAELFLLEGAWRDVWNGRNPRCDRLALAAGSLPLK